MRSLTRATQEPRDAWARWLKTGRLRGVRLGMVEALAAYETVIACTGAESDDGRAWAGVSCAQATGEILRVAVEGLAPEVILNGGQWVRHLTGGTAFDPEVEVGRFER